MVLRRLRPILFDGSRSRKNSRLRQSRLLSQSGYRALCGCSGDARGLVCWPNGMTAVYWKPCPPLTGCQNGRIQDFEVPWRKKWPTNQPAEASASSGAPYCRLGQRGLLLHGPHAEAQQRQEGTSIVDSQVHAYAANTPERPWHNVPNWPAHVTGDEMVSAMDKVGVAGAIYISPFSMYQYDASYAVSVQRAHPDRFALVKPVNPDDPAVADVIAEWKKTPGTVGIRIIMAQEAKRTPDDPGINRILRAAVLHDFPVNVLFWGNLDAGMALIDRHPDTRFIIDHMGILQPSVPPAPPQPWADLPKVVELAKRENAVIKITGACTLSKDPYPFPDIWDPLARIFDAWGFDRCLWGTDWTRTFAVVNYEQAVEPFLKTDRLSASERAMIMGGATAKAYGWSPKKV